MSLSWSLSCPVITPPFSGQVAWCWLGAFVGSWQICTPADSSRAISTAEGLGGQTLPRVGPESPGCQGVGFTWRPVGPVACVRGCRVSQWLAHGGDGRLSLVRERGAPSARRRHPHLESCFSFQTQRFGGLNTGSVGFSRFWTTVDAPLPVGWWVQDRAGLGGRRSSVSNLPAPGRGKTPSLWPQSRERANGEEVSTEPGVGGLCGAESPSPGGGNSLVAAGARA